VGSSNPKKVHCLNYSLNPRQFKFLVERFPEWHFVTRRSGTHDHPVSHTSTRIAAERLLDKLPRGTAASPKVYYDLHGNPSANEAYCRRHPEIRVVTIVELVTPRDYVRSSQKWGPEFAADGTARWITSSIRDFGLNPANHHIKIDGFISINTTYYYDQAEIAQLLAVFKCPYHALMHKFDKHFGDINDGEQHYEVRKQGSQNIVHQRNVLTGESYEHPNNTYWFEHDSFTWGAHGVGWDSHTITDELYHFIAVYCPAVQCRMSARCQDHAGVFDVVIPQHERATKKAQTQDEIANTRTVTIDFGSAKTRFAIRPQLVPFFGEMRSAVVHRARTSSQFADHVSRCKIKSKSIMATTSLQIEAQEIDDISLYSFFIDFQDQFGSAHGMMSQTIGNTIAADLLYREGAGYVSRGCFRALSSMLLAASDSKNIVQAVTRAGRAGVQHLERNRIT